MGRIKKKNIGSDPVTARSGSYSLGNNSVSVNEKKLIDYIASNQSLFTSGKNKDNQFVNVTNKGISSDLLKILLALSGEINRYSFDTISTISFDLEKKVIKITSNKKIEKKTTMDKAVNFIENAGDSLKEKFNRNI